MRKNKRFLYFSLCLHCIILLQIGCTRISDTIRIGTESQLPHPNECLGFKNIINWFLLSNIAEPLVTEDLYGRIRPGLATTWRVADAHTLCFTLPAGHTFSDGTVVNTTNVQKGLNTALATYPGDLATLKNLIHSIEESGPNEICIRYVGNALQLLQELSLPAAAPVVKAGEQCFYSGEFTVGDKVLIHRRSRQQISLVHLDRVAEKQRFLHSGSGLRIFPEVQMQTLPEEALENTTRMRLIPTRGANRTAFLYVRQPLPPDQYACLRKTLITVPWPFANASPAPTFLPLSYLGRIPDVRPDLGGMIRSTPAHPMTIVASAMYDSEPVERFFKHWFDSCNMQVTTAFFSKDEFEQYRTGRRSYQILMNTTGFPFIDPRPQLEGAFGMMEYGKSNQPVYPLTNLPPKKATQQTTLSRALIAWEKIIDESKQIIPIGHFSAYTIITGQHRNIDCLPRYTSVNTALQLGCLLADAPNKLH